MKLGNRLLSWLFSVLLVSAGASLSAKPQKIWRPVADGTAGSQSFVLYQDELGDTVCREATETERQQMIQRANAGDTRVIYPGAPLRSQMRDGAATWSPDAAGNLILQPSAGLRIVLHGTAQLDQNPTAKNAFIVAANRWESIISTPITIVIDVDFGTTFFGQPYPDASILGATGLDEVTGPFSDLRQKLIDSASSTVEQQLYNALPASAVPVELDGVNSNVASVNLTVPNARALGIVPDIADPSSVTLGNGDAGIGFNSAFQFDFNPDDGISTGQVDFDAVATHEIGHALGFVSESGGGSASPVSVWDLFRLRATPDNLGTFTVTPRVMSKGGTQLFFPNQVNTFATTVLQLSTGGPDPGPSDGDGRQSSHWKDDALSSLRPYIGVMDPTLASGLRRTISENDMMALDRFGYSISAPPPVRPPNDNFADAIVLQMNSGTLNGSNVSATREQFEPNHVGLTGDKSVWYFWTSPLNGQITIDTIGSNFDTTLAVYTGPVVGQLSNVAQNDDITAGTNKASRVQFNITAGTTYRIVVDGWNGEYGNITLNWNATGSVPTPTPTPTPTPSPTPTPTPIPSPTPIPKPPCLDDLWVATNTTNAPQARRLHSAVWTGSEMIIWGGQEQSGNPLNTGARYNPTTNTWTAISTTNAPAARSYHSAVWTGTEMIIWGGVNLNFNVFNTGARYNPSTDSWTPMTTVNAPAGRSLHSTVWTGSEMIVWGGDLGGGLNSGGRYNPSTDTWTPTSTVNAPAARAYHTAVWTGSEMIVWGGQGGGLFNTGGRYNPATDSWTATGTTNAPSVRGDHSAVWTGNEMIVWGGSMPSRTNTGGRYNPGSDSWTSTNIVNAPGAREGHTAVWSGTEMIVWGGSSTLNVGGRYKPATDSWTLTCDTNAAVARIYSTTVWTGKEMFVWGGDDNNFFRLNSGGRYSLQAPNSIDQSSFFVRQNYLDFLNREPDTPGLNFWTNEIEGCSAKPQCTENKRINVSAAFFLSIEFQDTGYLVERIYKTAYGDANGTSNFGAQHRLKVPIVRLNEFLSDTQKIGLGVVVNQGNWQQQLENNKQAFCAEFAQRSRFTTAFPITMTAAQFVDTLNTNAGNPLSQTERDQLVTDLSTNARTRAQVLRTVAEDPDLHRAEFNRAFVLMQFFGYLRRNPDDPQDTDYTGYDFWLTKLNQFNGNFADADMVKAFIASTEYRHRFGP